MSEPRTVFVPVFLIAQALLVHWMAGWERPPAPPHLSGLANEFGDWKQLREDTLDVEVVRELRADQLLSRTYRHKFSIAEANLFVAWFQSERGGTTQPHSPQVCLPAVGWTPASTGEIRLDTAAEAIAVNRYVVTKGRERAVVLYWYQTPRRVISSEWAFKFWLMTDALRDRRTDASLVRVLVWSAAGGDEAATVTAVAFTRSLYPVLREQFPR
jgi:EpsI family protein